MYCIDHRERRMRGTKKTRTKKQVASVVSFCFGFGRQRVDKEDEEHNKRIISNSNYFYYYDNQKSSPISGPRGDSRGVSTSRTSHHKQTFLSQYFPTNHQIVQSRHARLS